MTQKNSHGNLKRTYSSQNERGGMRTETGFHYVYLCQNKNFRCTIDIIDNIGIPRLRTLQDRSYTIMVVFVFHYLKIPIFPKNSIL